MPGLLSDLRAGWVIVRSEAKTPRGTLTATSYSVVLVRGNQRKYARAALVGVAMQRGLIVRDEQLRGDGSETWRLAPKAAA